LWGDLHAFPVRFAAEDDRFRVGFIMNPAQALLKIRRTWDTIGAATGARHFLLLQV